MAITATYLEQTVAFQRHLLIRSLWEVQVHWTQPMQIEIASLPSLPGRQLHDQRQLTEWPPLPSCCTACRETGTCGGKYKMLTWSNAQIEDLTINTLMKPWIYIRNKIINYNWVCAYVFTPISFSIHTYLHAQFVACCTHRQLHHSLKCFHHFPILCDHTNLLSKSWGALFN